MTQHTQQAAMMTMSTLLRSTTLSRREALKVVGLGPPSSVVRHQFLQAENRMMKEWLSVKRIDCSRMRERALLAHKANAVRREALLELDTIVVSLPVSGNPIIPS